MWNGKAPGVPIKGIGNMKDTKTPRSSLRDNHQRGNVGQYLADHIDQDSKLAFVSA
jgi:hypothetical protein